MIWPAFLFLGCLWTIVEAIDRAPDAEVLWPSDLVREGA